MTTKQHTKQRSTTTHRTKSAKTSKRGKALSHQRSVSRSNSRKRRDAWRNKETAQREYLILVAGMQRGPCFSFTLTKWRIRKDGAQGRDYNRDDKIRAIVWHTLWTGIKRAWPEAEAWTVAEYAQKTGVHLHVVVRHAPGLTKAWIEQKLRRQHPEFEIWEDAIWSADGWADYLTKTLSMSNEDAGWPHHFHKAAKSRGWLPNSLENELKIENAPLADACPPRPYRNAQHDVESRDNSKKRRATPDPKTSRRRPSRAA